jgi:hypothetical protein
MRVLAALCTTLLLGVSSCGSRTAVAEHPRANPSAPTSASPSASPSARPARPASLSPAPDPSLAEARHAWRAAVRDLVLAGSGTYTWSSEAGGVPVQSEQGSYAFQPQRAAIERTMSAKLTDGEHDVFQRLLYLPSGTYVQLGYEKGGGGCWLTVPEDDVVRYGSGLLGRHVRHVWHLPQTVVALLSLRITGAVRGSDASEMYLMAHLNGLVALQLLGLSIGAPQVSEFAAKAAAVTVPVGLTLKSDGSMTDLTVIGSTVYHALDRQDVPVDSVADAVTLLSASGSITGTGQPFTARRPSHDQLAAEGANDEPWRDATCPARSVDGRGSI